MTMTKEERLRKQRESRRLNGDMHTKKYEKTKKGKLMRTYRNMESRTKGIVKGKRHLYEGLGVMQRDCFYSWSLGDEDFNKLYQEWVDSGYEKRLSPSIDRVDTALGYVEGNVRWVTHSENSRLGAISRFSK